MRRIPLPWSRHAESVLAKSDSIKKVAEHCHGAAVDAGWWTELETGQPMIRNDGELLALIHGEISEALEGVRKNCSDKHLTWRPMVEVELADAVIRIMAFCEARHLDLAGAMAEKIEYNRRRKDHRLDHRAADGGKKF